MKSTEIQIPQNSDKTFPLCMIYKQQHTFDDIIIDDKTRDRLNHIIQENKHKDKLASYGLKPKNKILFCGPPGTGKTLSAKVLSGLIGYPLLYVTFDSVISSYLGETATNLRKIFDFIENGKFIVLLDEFDVIGKQRDDPNEHGEIKRIVNNFIQMLDNIDTNSIIIATTNHQHLLDKAIWRRFDDIIYFNMPDTDRRKKLFKLYLKPLKCDDDINIEQLADRTNYNSSADITQICQEALRDSIINNTDIISRDCIIHAISEQERRNGIINNKNKSITL